MEISASASSPAGGETVRGIADAEKKAAAINAVRQTLLATAAGTAAVVGLAFTARTFYLARRGQLTDRYTKAIAQLASSKLEERLGGIYGLEHLMRESTRDHDTVDVLAAFIREHAAGAPTTTVRTPVGAEAIWHRHVQRTMRTRAHADDWPPTCRPPSRSLPGAPTAPKSRLLTSPTPTCVAPASTAPVSPAPD